MGVGAGYVQGLQSYDPFDDRAVFEYKYSFMPRRCYNTRQLVWGLAVRGRRSYRTGDITFDNEDRWYHRDEAILKMLKG
jgi:hypothetical protein